jgi:ABC-type spermidine/putrescine transport system permease subunit I
MPVLTFALPAAMVMAAVFLIPFALVAWTSVGGAELTLAHFGELLSRPLYLRVLRNTLEISVVSTAATLLIAYPIAYHLARQSPRRRAFFMIFVLLPFWTSILVKSFAFTVLLGENGLINSALRAMFGAGIGMKLLFNRPGVIIGMAHYLLPFMVFTILTSLLAQSPDLRRAAEIMGAGRVRIFWNITLPLSAPGILAGSIICVIMSFGMFITPALLGGRADLMISNLVEFHVRETLNWNVAAAISIVLVAVTGAMTMLLARMRGDQLFGHD